MFQPYKWCLKPIPDVEIQIHVRENVICVFWNKDMIWTDGTAGGMHDTVSDLATVVLEVFNVSMFEWERVDIA